MCDTHSSDPRHPYTPSPLPIPIELAACHQPELDSHEPRFFGATTVSCFTGRSDFGDTGKKGPCRPRMRRIATRTPGATGGLSLSQSAESKRGQRPRSDSGKRESQRPAGRRAPRRPGGQCCSPRRCLHYCGGGFQRSRSEPRAPPPPCGSRKPGPGGPDHGGTFGVWTAFIPVLLPGAPP